MYSATAGTSPSMHPEALAVAGGSQPHNNMMPFETLTFIIALQGIFPPRS
jgi:microcystin-dependent protein